MCGRYSKDITDFIANYGQHLRDFLDAMADTSPQYNVAPSTTQVIRCGEGDHTFVQDAKWGLIPRWSKDGKGYQINSRSETVAEKPMFKNAFQKRRCVTWATGYYEWQTIGSGKQPYYIHFADHRPFLFYGVWGVWTHPETHKKITSFATMTTEPVENLARFHDRMPCMVDVDSSDVDVWLDHSDSDFEARHKLLRPYEAEKLIATPVSTYVNSVRNQGHKCIEPI